MTFDELANLLQAKYPHHREGDILLLNADCMDVMDMFPDKCVDLAITDPPYFKGVGKFGFYGEKISNTGVVRGNYKDINYWDENIPQSNYFINLLKSSKEQIVWGINYYAKHIDAVGRIVWDKKNDSSSFSKAEIASISLINSVQMFRYEWNGMLQGDMKNKELRIHPTQKPVKLYAWLLANYAKPGQLILDTHGGSFSSAIAAHYFGVKFIGVELDADYFSAAVERFKNETAQEDMFLNIA